MTGDGEIKMVRTTHSTTKVTFRKWQDNNYLLCYVSIFYPQTIKRICLFSGGEGNTGKVVELTGWSSNQDSTRSEVSLFILICIYLPLLFNF